MNIELQNPPIVEKRKLVKSGASIVVTLPKKWLEENKLKADDEIIVIANGDLQLMKDSDENKNKINKKILDIRNQFAHNPAAFMPIIQRSGTTGGDKNAT